MIDFEGELRRAFRAVAPEALELIRRVVREEIGRAWREDPEKLIGIEEAAGRLGLSVAAARKAAWRGALPVRRVGRRLRVRLGDLAAPEHRPRHRSRRGAIE